MNIAVFADVHGRILLCFKLCARWERETGERLDAILQAGDLGVFPDRARLDRATIRHAAADPTELGFLDDFVDYHPRVAAVLGETRCPLIFVRGNHEDHAWLDALERRVPLGEALFPVDAYRRIYCLKSGVPHTIADGATRLTVLGIGRVGPPAGEGEPEKPTYIQPYEAERLYGLGRLSPHVLLTHDSARDFVTPGYGMEEIRLALDAFRPRYHFYGHTGRPFERRLDANGVTVSCKLSDLHWDDGVRGRPLALGAMGVLCWRNADDHSFEVVDGAWLKDYRAYTWQYAP